MFLLFLNLRAVPKKSTPAKLAYIRHFQRIGINETKFEKMPFILKVMFSPPSPSWMFNSSVLCPSALRSNNFTKSNLKICFLLVCFHQMWPCKSFWYNKKIKKSYWTTVANTSPYTSVHSGCAHLKTWKCQIFRGLPPPRFLGQTVDRCITTSTPSSSYPPLAFLSLFCFFFLPFLSFAQALPWFSSTLFSHHPTLDSHVLAETLWF